jgi:predicted alpha/beta superfamily hydrolase
MKLFLIFFVFSINFFRFFSQSNERVDSLFSGKLNQYRSFKTFLHGNISNNCKIHTIYVFDSQNENLYNLVNNIIHFQYNEVYPILVVGVISENRNSDFLIQSNYKSDIEQYGLEMGKFEDFESFISTELIPFIEKEYSASHQRWAIGHSNGGTFLLNQWLTKPELFSARILIDPNFMFANNNVSNAIKQLVSPEKYNQSLIYLSRAFYPQSSLEWSKQSNLGLTSLKKIFGKNKQFKFENFESEFNHYSVIPAACQNGLTFLFNQTFFNPDYFLDFTLKNCSSIDEKNTIALNYLVSMDFRGYHSLSYKSAQFIDQYYVDIHKNKLDVLTNFNLASKFENWKLYKSAFLLFENCLCYVNANKEKMEEGQNYKELIENKIKMIKSKLK